MLPLVVAAMLWRPAGPADPPVVYLVRPATPQICHGTWCEPAQPETIVGGWNTQEYYYREYDAKSGKWGKVTKPPIDPPSRPKSRPNHGVDPSQPLLPLRQAPKPPPDFPDDSKLPRLTTIGIKVD